MGSINTDIQSYEELEQRILKTFEEISPLPFLEFHSLMQEYGLVLTDLRAATEDSVKKADAFNEKLLYVLQSVKENGGRYYFVHPIKDEEMDQFVKVNFNERFARYIIFNLSFQRESEKGDADHAGRYVCVKPFAWYGDLTGQHLCNQILAEESESEELTYNLQFNRGLAGNVSQYGVPFSRPNYDNMQVERGYFVLQERLLFPEGRLIKQAHIMERWQPGLSRPPTLFSVDINLLYDPK